MGLNVAANPGVGPANALIASYFDTLIPLFCLNAKLILTSA